MQTALSFEICYSFCQMSEEVLGSPEGPRGVFPWLSLCPAFLSAKTHHCGAWVTSPCHPIHHHWTQHLGIQHVLGTSGLGLEV